MVRGTNSFLGHLAFYCATRAVLLFSDLRVFVYRVVLLSARSVQQTAHRRVYFESFYFHRAAYVLLIIYNRDVSLKN